MVAESGFLSALFLCSQNWRDTCESPGQANNFAPLRDNKIFRSSRMLAKFSERSLSK
jgi:hypothetical protein